MKVVFPPAVCSDDTGVKWPSDEFPALITATNPVVPESTVSDSSFTGVPASSTRPTPGLRLPNCAVV